MQSFYHGAISLTALSNTMDFKSSSHHNLWTLSVENLALMRSDTNSNAIAISATSNETNPPSFQANYSLIDYNKSKTSSKTSEEDKAMKQETSQNPQQNNNDNTTTNALTPSEELDLLRFYCSSLPDLCGPKSTLLNNRLRRTEKVCGTANLFLRRFFLSNSVVLFDPKKVMVACVLLASKTEDSNIDVNLLVEATEVLQSGVCNEDILSHELKVLMGLNFNLHCFHPFNPMVAFLEDLRQLLLSKVGDGEDKLFVSNKSGFGFPDFKSLHEISKAVINDAVFSDLVLIHAPSKIALACLFSAVETLSLVGESKEETEMWKKVDISSYILTRFTSESVEARNDLLAEVKLISSRISEVKEGKWGSALYGIDRAVLKGINKKLKKCKLWGEKSEKKKRKKGEGGVKEEGSEGERKRIKVE